MIKKIRKCKNNKHAVEKIELEPQKLNKIN